MGEIIHIDGNNSILMGLNIVEAEKLIQEREMSTLGTKSSVAGVGAAGNLVHKWAVVLEWNLDI